MAFIMEDNLGIPARLKTKDAAFSLLKLALPVMAGSVIESVYNITDAFFLGKLGTAQISAPSIAFSVNFFFIIFGTGLSASGTTLIAQSRGKGEVGKMDYYANQLASLMLVLSIIAALLGSVLAGPIIRILQTPDEVYIFARDYLGIILTGLPFVFIYFVLQAVFIAIGDTLTPLVVHLVAVLLNVGLDPLLIFGLGPFPAMGVSGAAIATVISQAIGAVLSVVVLVKGKGGIKIDLAKLKPQWQAWRLLLKIGLPSGLGQAASAFGFTIMQGLVNSMGTAVIAAFGVGSRIFNMFDIPAFAISNASTSVVGRSMGARDEHAARKYIRAAVILVIILEVPLLSIAMTVGGDLVRIFVNDPEVIRLGDIMFKVIAPSLLMFSLYLSLTGAFQGAGDTKIIMILSIIRLWGIRLPLAYIIHWIHPMGPYSVWIAMFASNAITSLIGWLYYRKGKWKKALNPDEI